MTGRMAPPRRTRIAQGSDGTFADFTQMPRETYADPMRAARIQRALEASSVSLPYDAARS